MTTALVVGLGAAGRRHAEVLRQLRPDSRIVAVSRSTEAAPSVDLVLGSIEEALRERPTVAVLAGPATSRVAMALKLARADVHLLLEKPASVDLRGLRELAQLAEQRGITIAVGYNLRFFPPLEKVKATVAEGTIGEIRNARLEVGQYLPDWRPGIDHRSTVSAQRALGGGALLELSHELDYLGWIMGRATKVWATLAQLGDLDIDVEDAAEVVAVFESGAVASVHLDMLQRPPTRTARFVGENGSIVGDLRTGEVTLHQPGIDPRPLAVSGPVDLALTYVAQMEDFLAAASASRSPSVPLADGIAAVELITAARQSAAAGCAVTLGGETA